MATAHSRGTSWIERAAVNVGALAAAGEGERAREEEWEGRKVTAGTRGGIKTQEHAGRGPEMKERIESTQEESRGAMAWVVKEHRLKKGVPGM
eukprot:6184602-Pleurochrysis_carterae.AAC.2